MPFKFNPITTKLDLVEDFVVPPSAQQDFVTDAGTATSVADSINVLGGANINTAGVGATVTVALDSAVTTTSYATDNAASGLTIENNTVTADGTDANIDIGLVAKGTSGGVYSPTHITIGQNSSVPSFPFAGSSVSASLLVSTDGATDAAGISEIRHGTTASLGSNLVLGRSRGTFAAPTIVQNGDSVGRIAFASYDGANYQYSAQIQCNVAAAPGVADTPGNLLLQTVPDGSSTPTTALTISSAQVTTLAQPLPVGSGGLGITTTPTNGQIPIGNGTNYTAATLTAGTGISITNAAGSVTVANTGSAGAMTLLHTITFNNTASSYDLTAYVTGYDTYKFIGSAMENLTGVGSSLGIQFSTDAGFTFLSAGYITFFQYFQAAGGGYSGLYTDHIPIAFLNGSLTYLNSCDAMMTGYGSSSGAIVQSYYMGSTSGSTSNQISSGNYFGSTLNGIRIVNIVGTNFISGKFSIYGIAT